MYKRQGEQLHTTPQTLSAQIKLLEDWLGRKLFRKSGRNLELTEDGHLALGYADQIFTLGAELEAAVRQACLLYTSPSPRDRTRSRMPSSA